MKVDTFVRYVQFTDAGNNKFPRQDLFRFHCISLKAENTLRPLDPQNKI